MTPMGQTFSPITRLLSMEKPERHLLEVGYFYRSSFPVRETTRSKGH